MSEAHDHSSKTISVRSAPGVERPKRFRPTLRYELIGCGLHGHELLGTDAATIRPQDAVFARNDSSGLRWFRCLRCDSWLPLAAPVSPRAAFPPSRDEVDPPLRGRPLRDRYVLRVIAVDRAVHVLVLATLAVALFAFAAHRSALHHDYTRILADLQGGVGGPINDSHHGLLSDFNRVFSLTRTELYLAGAALAAYGALLVAEMVGLWFAKRWAEYLTFAETSLLVPFEIYELTNGVSALKMLALVINAAVVAYLLVAHRLFGVRGGEGAAQAERVRDTGWAAIERATPVGLTVPASGGHPAS